MRSKNKRKAPEVVLCEGKPAAVILEIEEYRERGGCGETNADKKIS